MMSSKDLRARLQSGLVIPALPLALDANRQWSEKHQRAVLRYYLDAGVGGVAVGVHSTQFQIRDPQHGLYAPLLAFAAETMHEWLSNTATVVRIAGVCGETPQALAEAELAGSLDYDAALLSLGAWREAPETAVLAHCQQVSLRLPLIGFYLQAAVGGRRFSYDFWRRFADIPNVVAIKMAPFNRYQTLDVVRAVQASGRSDIALYTGNDDNIIADLLTPFGLRDTPRFVSGGLLGQWGVWTERAVALLDEIKAARTGDSPPSPVDWLRRNAELTDANGAVFDVAHQFAGCIPGIHEILRRQGILATNHCLDPAEVLSPGQAAELDRVTAAYPWLVDDAFVAENLSRWLR